MAATLLAFCVSGYVIRPPTLAPRASIVMKVPPQWQSAAHLNAAPDTATLSPQVWLPDGHWKGKPTPSVDVTPAAREILSWPEFKGPEFKVQPEAASPSAHWGELDEASLSSTEEASILLKAYQGVLDIFDKSLVSLANTMAKMNKRDE